MEDLNSNISIQFVDIFKKQMTSFYESLLNFQGIEVIKLSRGSVVVDHNVLFNASFSGFNASYSETMDAIQEGFRNKSWNQETLHFNKTSRVKEVFLSPADLSKACRNKQLVPQDFQSYYVARNISDQLQCVSNCSVWHPNTFTCDHGNCYIQASGPSCYCEQSDSYWYVGSRCEGRISKVGVAVGVSLGLAALLLLILVLALLLGWRRCPRKEKDCRLMGPPDEEKWHEDSPEWSAGPQGPDPDTDSWPESEGAPTSSVGQGSFRPRLDKVDTSLQARIARPQVTRL